MKKIIIFLLVILFIFIVGCSQQEVSIQTPTRQNTETVNVEIRDFAYTPQTITIKKGTTVTWIQKDSVKHTVTSDNGIFDSALLSKGQTWSYTFSEAGTFEYHCTPHPYMEGTIIVE